MANLKSRVERLEKSISPINQETAQHYKYTWGDWTDEELHLATKHFRSSEALPWELEEKILFTRPSGRLAGMTEEDKEEALRQLVAAYDDELGDEDDQT